MEELSEGVRELHQRVEALGELLHRTGEATDFSDRRADAAHDVAERNSFRIRRLFVAGLIVAFGWTPFTAYGAVWVHERVRNTCYPGVVHVEGHPTAGEAPWYCGIFPGTGRPGPH